MMHAGDIMIHVGGYHEYIEECSVHRGFQYKSKAFINFLPHMNHDIPSMYSSYPSDILNTARCTQDIPPHES